jgi:hypothetical protein
MAPRSVARGVPQSGDRAAAGMPDRAKVHVGANSPLRGRIFLWKTLLCPSRSPPMLPQPGWDVALRTVCLVRLLAKGNDPERGPRGPAKRGIGQRRGCQDRAKNLLGRVCSRYGVASSFGRHCSALRGRTIRVVAFRASHPAKPRRASGDLFSGSLKTRRTDQFGLFCSTPVPQRRGFHLSRLPCVKRLHQRPW